MIKVAIYLNGFNFEVTDNRVAVRAPIRHVGIAIDESLIVEFDKSGADGFRQTFIECKTLAFPITGAPEFLELRNDIPGGFIFPLPHTFDEFFTSEFGSAGAFFGELSLHNKFGDNTGVVGPRHPEGVITLHASPSDEAILERIVEGVPDV